MIRVHSLEELTFAREWGVREVIIALEDFSRWGGLPRGEAIALAQKAKQWGVRTLFQWDILMVETVFCELREQVPSLFREGGFGALRVQDAGALQWAFEKTDFPLHWIGEAGPYNLVALKKLEEFFGGRLERLVLSLQLPREKLSLYSGELHTPLELMGLGPILLYYSPRHLLQEQGTFLASSEEGAHRNFPVISNGHGTFFFHQKHHWLLEYTEDLEEWGIAHFRLEGDRAFLQRALELIQKPSPDNLGKFQRDYPVPLIRGFFHRNKSDILFSKLKNQQLEQRRDSAFGVVVSVEKGRSLGVELFETPSHSIGSEVCDSNSRGQGNCCHC